MNKGYYHEAADRLHVELDNIERNLKEHKAFEKKKYQKKLLKAQEILFGLYQIMNAKM